MNHKFGEFTNTMALVASRREAIKKFGVALAGLALACLGLATKAEARLTASYCNVCMKNCKTSGGSEQYCKQACRDWCG